MKAATAQSTWSATAWVNRTVRDREQAPTAALATTEKVAVWCRPDWPTNILGANAMLGNKQAFTIGACEHPTPKASDKSTVQFHAECATGPSADAGLTKDHVYCWRHLHSTDTGGSAHLQYVAHTVRAIARNDCVVAFVEPRQTKQIRLLSERHSTGHGVADAA